MCFILRNHLSTQAPGPQNHILMEFSMLITSYSHVVTRDEVLEYFDRREVKREIDHERASTPEHICKLTACSFLPPLQTLVSNRTELDIEQARSSHSRYSL
jgi:hypothetical protein